jgi:hypothetical protein
MSAEVIRVEQDRLMAIVLPIQQVFSLLPAQSISFRLSAAE